MGAVIYVSFGEPGQKKKQVLVVFRTLQSIWTVGVCVKGIHDVADSWFKIDFFFTSVSFASVLFGDLFAIDKPNVTHMYRWKNFIGRKYFLRIYYAIW